MFRNFWNGRGGHYTLLMGIAAALCFPNLGTPSLWDIDEGHNAEAAREMLDSGDWVVPTFNYQLRVDKPALLYWLQIAGYRLFGVNEWGARFPSALAALAAVLATYELGRRLFNPYTGLLGGIILASAPMFCASAHFANPDALLDLFTALTLLFFWMACEGKHAPWVVLAGLCAGLSVLAKGPVGLVLPSAVSLAYLVWTRQISWIVNRYVGWGTLAFALVALPWYALVGVETKANFLSGFFLTHNVGRFLSPMENHRGSIFYYLVVLAVGFAPWSSFFGLIFYPWRKNAADAGFSNSSKFLLCWILVYLVFFSFSQTKLPNYILPLYPPLALLCAKFWDEWKRGVIHPPQWAFAVGLCFFLLVGAGTTLGLSIGGGFIDLSLIRGRSLPGLERGAFLGVIPVLGATVAWLYLRKGLLSRSIQCLTLSSLLFTGGVAALGVTALDQHKAPKPLARVLRDRQGEPEIRVGCYEYYQPSLVFYCRREVSRLADEEKTLEFLNYPVPVYLFLPNSAWENLKSKVKTPCRSLGNHYDLYRHCQVMLVTNR